MRAQPSCPSLLQTAQGEQAALCRLVRSLGQSHFMDDFADQCSAMFGAEQITAFIVEETRARCVLAHRPSGPRTVQSLVRMYTRGFVQRDPLLSAHRARGETFAAASIASADIPDDVYRHRLFLDAGLQSKISLFSRQDGRALYVNFYFRTAPVNGEAAIAHLNGYGHVLAACLHKHEALTGGSFQAGTARSRAEAHLQDRFPALSARERQVLAAIACGLSVEAIALELEVAPASVVTFRRRGYAKLSITSRGELFAQLSGLTM